MIDMFCFYFFCDVVVFFVGVDVVVVVLFWDQLVWIGLCGMFWLELLFEVEIVQGWIGFGLFFVMDVKCFVDVGFFEDDVICFGKVEDLFWMKVQCCVIFECCGFIDLLDFDVFEVFGGLDGLWFVFGKILLNIVEIVICFGLCGCGGVGFLVGIKWKMVFEVVVDQKYICCNVDEGDSGIFVDCMLMEGDFGQFIVGMIIVGFVVGVIKGFIYCCLEYLYVIVMFKVVISVWEVCGWLGLDIFGFGKVFEFQFWCGVGFYVCGEESVMLESLEGKCGQVWVKFFMLVIFGLFGKLIIVNNVLILVSVFWILVYGGEVYVEIGYECFCGIQVY